MKKVRIEIHLETDNVEVLDKIAKERKRSRKNLCESEILKLIDNSKKEINLSNNIK